MITTRMDTLVEVILKDTDRLEWALKQFKKQVRQSGVLRDLRKKRYYIKPWMARQIKMAAARRRRLKPVRDSFR